MLILGFALIYLYSEFINKVFKNSWARALLSSLIISLYHIAGKYHFRVKTSFDFSIVIDNFFEIFNEASTSVIWDTLKPKDFYITFFIFFILILLHSKWKIFALKKEHDEKARKQGFSFVFIYCVLLFILPFPHGELSYVTKSVIDFYLGGVPTSKNFENLKNNSDLFKQKFVANNINSEKVDIFIIEIESFNSLYVNHKAKNGKLVTPVFDRLIQEGLYVEDFYGNSVQTIKGQYATLCSRVPLLKGKSSYKLNGKDLICAPRIFKEHGYFTYFHKCFSSLNFDNTGPFMKELGFDLVRTSDYSLLTDEQKKNNIWGWGMQDNLSYKQYIDQVIELKKKYQKPVFSLIHTVSHHMKFNHVPETESKLYSRPASKLEHFQNSLNTTDRYLGELIEYMKEKNLYENSLIIITGDHSYPAGEHGFFDNQTSYFQEFFKTPFLMIWKNKIMPQLIKEKTYSHTDVLPTLIKLMNFEGEYKLVGKNILSKEGNFAYLVQPYNGMYLGVLKWPYKYIWERKTGRDLLYDLSKDPLEENPLQLLDVIDQYKEQLDYLILGTGKN